jgi:outer membrane protein assembly factor BamB
MHYLFIGLALFCCSVLSAQTPNLLWAFDTQDNAFGQTALADVDGDGRPEVFFGCYRNDGMLYALNSSGSLRWSFDASGFAEGCNDTAPLLADVDGDGQLDLVLASSCNPTTFCFDANNGQLKWSTPTRGSDSPPTLGDVDGDGLPELLHGQFGGYLLCINPQNGAVKWEIAVDVNSWVQTAPTLVDLNSDGRLDIVVATWNFSGNSQVYAYDGLSRQTLWTRPVNDYVYHGTAVTDLDSDGAPDLVLGDYSGRLWALKGSTGAVLWTFDAVGYVGSPVSVADLNGDGSCELVFGGGYRMYALNTLGQQQWAYTIPGYGSSFRGAALSDVTNDGLPDVLFGTTGGHFVGLQGNTGQELFLVDLGALYGDTMEVGAAPVVGDLNGDGRRDAVIVAGHTKYPNFQSNYGRAFAFDLGPGQGPEWAMFQYDERRTGSLCSDSWLGQAELPELWGQVAPNPAADRFVLNVEAAGIGQTYCLRDALGRKWKSGRVEQESQTVNLEGLPAGVYFLQLSQGWTARVVVGF